MEKRKSNKLSLIISSIALVLSITVVLALLFCPHLNGKSASCDLPKEAQTNVIAESTMSSGDIKIAYVNLDTLLFEYKLSIKLNEDLLTKQAKSRSNFEYKLRAFEKKYSAFAEKARLGSFISQASMESQQNELLKEQGSLENLEKELTEELMQQQAEMNSKLFENIMTFVKTNYQGKYSMIFGNAAGSTVLYSEPSLDITREVVERLNAEYDSESAE